MATLLGFGTPCFAIPELNAVASLVLPGLGQAINGDYGAGAFQFGSALVLSRQYGILVEKDEYIEPEDRLNEDTNEIETNETTFYADAYGSALLNLSFYSSFAAYRDARLAMNNQGYATPPPQETIGDLVAAPFSWEFLSRPTTFIPLLLPLYLLATPVDDEQVVYAPDDSITRDEMAKVSFFQFGGVAIGEEAFFRGFVNNGLSSGFGETWGLVGSSALFGWLHSGNPGQADSLTAGIFGLYLGWLQQRNEYGIGQGVAIHFWWDFLITLALLREHEQGNSDSNNRIVLYSYYSRF